MCKNAIDQLVPSVKAKLIGLENIGCIVGNANMPISQTVKYPYLGLVAFASPAFHGSVHDMTIFSSMAPTYSLFLLKSPQDAELPDSEAHQTSWSILVDKGYVGAAEKVRCMVPKKRNQIQTAEDVQYNIQLSSTRVICENFYGRMKLKFKAASDCFKGDPKNYEMISDICIALTNFDVIQRPLRQDDRTFYAKLLKNEKKKHEEARKKRHEKYLEKKSAAVVMDAEDNPFFTPRCGEALTGVWTRNTQ